MDKARTYMGPLGEITSFPSILGGLLNGAELDGAEDYGALYALPADQCKERRAKLDASGYWSHR